MELPEAVDKFREYWPDTKGTMWGEAFETICAKAVESAPSASTNTDMAAETAQIADCMVRLCSHINELSKDQIADNIMAWSRQLRHA